jgi:hypothetical protein
MGWDASRSVVSGECSCRTHHAVATLAAFHIWYQALSQTPTCQDPSSAPSQPLTASPSSHPSQDQSSALSQHRMNRQGHNQHRVVSLEVLLLGLRRVVGDVSAVNAMQWGKSEENEVVSIPIMMDTN